MLVKANATTVAQPVILEDGKTQSGFHIKIKERKVLMV